ncbi:hypothetical protein EJB05_38379 [Eragrostis curvula]|uniref:non-specific serine/threonine protein kinase n=1 Tax=Eragrostis curvula TaxID=38414 RepID=A0A5J9TU21_9POAL|nr:hypothetical protein EJB05_38379 [Eragrostis curvula]
MGNCFGLEEAEVEAVKNYGHHGQTQAAAARALPMAAPKPADASMSSGHRGSRSPSPSTNSSSTTARSGADAGAYPEGRILETPNLRIFTFGELRAATRNFKPDTVLGEGGFGRVYKGWVDERTMSPVRCGTGMVVAVKKLNPESVQGMQEWQSEVNFMGSLSHPNLVRLLGYCVEDKELLLVYEFMAKGSLENHLFRKGGTFEPISWKLRLHIALGAARGLAFLHSSEKQVIYRDFKASNILLDMHYNAKLSDFGLAKNGPTGGDSHVTTRVMGTYGYAAPEYVATGTHTLAHLLLPRNSNQSTAPHEQPHATMPVEFTRHLYVKSDVYGFGVVLLEMLTGLRAMDPGRPAQQHNLVDWAKPYLADRRRLARLVDPRLEGQYPSKAALQAAQLTLRCLAGDPRSRPSMAEVVASLEEVERITARRESGGEGHHRSSRSRSGSDGARSSHHPSPSSSQR